MKKDNALKLLELNKFFRNKKQYDIADKIRNVLEDEKYLIQNENLIDQNYDILGDYENRLESCEWANAFFRSLINMLIPNNTLKPISFNNDLKKAIKKYKEQYK